MRLLVFAINKRLPRPIPNHDDLMGIVDDAVMAVMQRLSVDVHEMREGPKQLRSNLHYQNLYVFHKPNRTEDISNPSANTLNQYNIFSKTRSKCYIVYKSISH